MPSLVLIKSPGGLVSGQAFPVAGDELLLGRDAGCTVVIPNNAVSRQHARVVRDNGRFLIEDLKSRNKTFVNNQEVTAAVPLKHDDRIKICDYLFRFHDERQPVRRPPPPDPDPPDDPHDAALAVRHAVDRTAARELLTAPPAEQLRVLHDISVGLARAVELGPLLPQIADTLFGVFRQADRCFLVLLDEAGRPAVRAVKSRRPGADEERFSRTIVRRCMETGTAFLTDDAQGMADLASAVSVAAIQLRSVMCVPLAAADGKPLGAIQLDTHDVAKKFRPDDLNLLAIVGNLASAAVERAQLHAGLVARDRQQFEIDLARKVQLGFLPQACPDVPGYEFFAYYSAAQAVGGDYYDFIPLPGGRLAVVLGDVAGKGVPASLLMAKLSAEARFCLLTEPDPAAAVARLNDHLVRGGIGDRFVTLAAVVLDPAAHTAVLVNAGHITPQKVTADTRQLADAMPDADGGPPLGLAAGMTYTAVTTPLTAGECVLMYTDGVTDAVGPAGVLFGFAGVQAAVGDDGSALAEYTPRAVGDRLVRAVTRHAAGRPQADDIAVVCLGRVDLSPHQTSVSLTAPRVFDTGSGVLRPDPGPGTGLVPNAPLRYPAAPPEAPDPAP